MCCEYNYYIKLVSLIYTKLNTNNFFTLLLYANARGRGSRGKGGGLL